MYDVTPNIAAPISLAAFTRRELLVPQLRERDTAGIISELSQVLQRQGSVPDMLPFYQAALNRELLANSAIETGLAFPHARLSGVRQLQFAMGRAGEPVIWGARGSRQVALIFLIAVPATESVSYLNLLASLARLGQQPELLAQLRAAQPAEAILAVLEKIKLRQG
jgi:mannitol/fructose-specific phosphotransferase system IIA component (Ntr-type)